MMTMMMTHHAPLSSSNPNKNKQQTPQTTQTKQLANPKTATHKKTSS
jgi:hypothetical protein